METVRFKTIGDAEAFVIASVVAAVLPPSATNAQFNDRDYCVLVLLNGLHLVAHSTLEEMEEKFNLIGLGLEDG